MSKVPNYNVRDLINVYRTGDADELGRVLAEREFPQNFLGRVISSIISDCPYDVLAEHYDMTRYLNADADPTTFATRR